MVKGEHLEFEWDANNEGLVWTEDGMPLQGLTGGGDRIEWIIPQSWRDGDEHVFYIEMACNKMFGNSPVGDTIQPPIPNQYYQLHKARIVDVNLAARQLFVDFWIIGDAAREFPGDSWERHRALDVCNRIMDTFYAGEGSTKAILDCRKIAEEYIGDVNSAKVYDSGQETLVNAIGHCHIDTAWLWPFAETKRKIARSWLSQCDLLDRYPEHRFVCSSGQQYKWFKTLYPCAWDRIKAHVKAGGFQPVGGSWIEHDTNIPSGESLVRQFLYGQRFFESNFGERCKTFWLPDTFGYSAQLPQLCRLAGLNRFLTQKLSWNNINNFPHTTFNWVSLDGSQVLCHMPPSETYTADAHFGDVKRSISQHKSMDQDNTSLLVFGKGDGGGGPTFMMLEKLRRCRGISDKTSPLLPRVKMGNSVEDFFDALETKVEDGMKLVTWYGELYFELHRGTYTTQAVTKRNNRKQEIMMHDLEYLATMATLKEKSYSYPKKDIDDIWENILYIQNHDCIAGSCIEICYREADEAYATNLKTGKKAIEKALKALGLSSDVTPGDRIVGINTLPWQRSEIVKIPGIRESSDQSHYAVLSGPAGIAKVAKCSSLADTVSVEEIRSGVFVLENSKLRAEIESGVITSLYDRVANREVLAKGKKANQLVIFDDKPLYWQAWDVEVYHLASRKEISCGPSEILEEGPYRVSVATKAKISDRSWIKTVISLDAHGDSSGYVQVEAEVEWQENMKFLKVEFPVDIVNTEATYEIQYGLVRRPTHYNTSWDLAKFEVCCHKFADLSEANYGVSILNESKYGFATAGNLMRLSLLKAPKAPDFHADLGRHHIKWAIMPHMGALSHLTVQAAHNFNYPMTLASVISNKPEKDFFKSIQLQGNPSLVLDFIKRGEDDEDVSRGELKKRSGRSIILRIYDSLGGRSRGTIKTTLPVKKVWKTNLLEDDEEEYKIADGEIDIELRQFEVATFRLQL